MTLPFSSPAWALHFLGHVPEFHLQLLAQLLQVRSDLLVLHGARLEGRVRGGTQGIKAIMDQVAKSTATVDVNQLRRVAQTHPHTVQDLEDWKRLYRALEKLVEEEAAKVVSIVAEENGFEAWRQLRLRFEQELGA